MTFVPTLSVLTYISFLQWIIPIYKGFSIDLPRVLLLFLYIFLRLQEYNQVQLLSLFHCLSFCFNNVSFIELYAKTLCFTTISSEMFINVCNYCFMHTKSFLRSSGIYFESIVHFSLFYLLLALEQKYFLFWLCADAFNRSSIYFISDLILSVVS